MMEYHAATTAASVAVQKPPRIEPRMMTKVNRAGIAWGMVFSACRQGVLVLGQVRPFLVKCARTAMLTIMAPQSRTPGSTPP